MSISNRRFPNVTLFLKIIIIPWPLYLIGQIKHCRLDKRPTKCPLLGHFVPFLSLAISHFGGFLNKNT